ncbi:MAG TPA: DUF1549 domain-containing protein [Vicinamibacterales bacterium]|nr:DUF1549 domain-containing protein [Vicinamibacterales bacterium]
MRLRRSLWAWPAVVAAGVWTAAVLARVQAIEPETGQVSSLIDYDRQVRPIIEARCLECHSQEARKGGLSLASYGDALDGGRSGAAIRPGSAAGSLLVHRILGDVEPQMPKDERPLSEAEVALIRRWIDEGARATPTSPPAPPPWEAPLALEAPAVPDVQWAGWTRPLDRLLATYLSDHQIAQPALVDDRVFARRVHLDVWGLLPDRASLEAFLRDPAPDKRERLVARLLADDEKYAEGWISFWNDLLRNEDGVTYFSEDASRTSITPWLLSALQSNLPYDRFVTTLLNPTLPDDPAGFLTGVNWRGETSAAVTPWMQASQNTAQVFLGVNMKCNACHDSFVNRWKLKDAYGLAAFFSPEPRLQLFRCDVARNEYAEPWFLYPELHRTPPSPSLADRRATAAAIFTDPRNGRMPRTLVNRIWGRLLGRGIVGNPDEMDGVPWSPAVLDWLASDFAGHGYDLKRLIGTIVTSRAYQMPAVPRAGEVPARDYVFKGPEVRRLTAEQFADAVGAITGEWTVAPVRGGTAPPAPARGTAPRTDSDPVTVGVYAREWRAGSTHLTRALGRPIRDQVISSRPTQATTLQALEFVNGQILVGWLQRGARRLIGELPPEPVSRFNAAVGGRTVTPRSFDVDISAASWLWLLVTDTGSNAPERVLPVWANAELVGPDGVTPLASLAPVDRSGLRPSDGADSGKLTVKNPSRLVFDISGRGFTRFRGTADLENPRSEVGATLNPALRFFIFDVEPTGERLIPPAQGTPLPPPPAMTTTSAVVEHLFWSALNRPPGPEERRLAEAAASDPARPGQPAPDGVADLLWAVLMKPEFQLIY